MTTARKRTLICLATFIIALILACGFSFSAPLVAQAILPDSWNTAADKSTGDWYLDADNLDVDGLKSVVEWWKVSAAYDLTALADDPVVVAVIDSGVNYNHDIFGGENCPDVFLRDGDGNMVCANTAGGNSVLDDAGNRHGTHVAGIVAVLIHAFDLEDYIKIMPIKAGTPKDNDASFAYTDVREAVDFAVANGADVINLSLTADSAYWASAVTAAAASQAVVVAAAGNSGKSSASGDYYPAESDHVVGVMNYTENTLGAKVLSSTSNYGSGFDIAAPGYGILSADGSTSADYKNLTGTSMASPIVAFAAALLQLKWRASLETEVPDGVSEAQCVREVLALHTADSAYSSKDGKYYTALDLESLIVKDFVYSSAKGEMVVADNSVSVAIQPVVDDIVLGEAGTLRLEAALQGGAAGDFDFVWTVSFGDSAFTKVGQAVNVEYTAPETPLQVHASVEVYSKQNGALVGTDEITLSTVYQSPSSSDIYIAVDGVSADGEAWQGTVESGAVFSVSNDVYLSPDLEFVWYVDDEETARGRTFEPSFAESGKHTVIVEIYEDGVWKNSVTLTAYFEKEKDSTNLGDFFESIKESFEGDEKVLIIVGIVLAVAVIVAAGIVIALLVRRGRKRP